MKNDLELKREIDPENGLPLQLQVSNVLRKEILQTKNFNKDNKIATEFELMERFGVSRVTIRNALKLLVEEGVIYRERGRGTFARKNNSDSWAGRLLGFTEAIKEMGYTPDASILRQGPLFEGETYQLCKEKLKARDIWELKRLRFADKIPAGLEQAFYPSSYGTVLKKQDLKSIAIYKYLEEELGVELKDAQQIISAVNADANTSKLLNVQEGDALLYVERITTSSDKEPVEFLKAIYRPDYFHYLIKLSKSKL